MSWRKTKGFTLIELMIVLAIIGVLSVVIIPKALPLKNQAKNKEVQSNVLIVRSFLENRAGADRINIITSLGTETIENSLLPVKDDIALKIVASFSGGNEVKNPFNNKIAVNSTSPNISNTTAQDSSIVIGYDTGIMPTDVLNITSTVTVPGVTAIIVYQTGYVVYGIDNFGGMIEPVLMNMPSNVAQSPNVKNPQPPNDSILPNVTKLVDYLNDKVIEDIVVGNKDSAAMSLHRCPLMITDLGTKGSVNQIINPFVSNIASNTTSTVIGNYTAIGNSILLENTYVSSSNLNYSDYKGFIVVDLLDNGNGYSVYGIDSAGNKVTTPSSTITGATAAGGDNAVLLSNLTTLKTTLKARIGNDVSTIATKYKDTQPNVSNILINDLHAGGDDLKSLQATLSSPNIIYNAYNPHWSQISPPQAGSLNSPGYSIILSSDLGTNTNDFVNYRGTVVVHVTDEISNSVPILRYTIYGIDSHGKPTVPDFIDCPIVF